MRVIMLGAPGAGKGTQAVRVAEKYAIPHISTGDIFRANIKGGTELGKKAKSYMDAGKLVPDEAIVSRMGGRRACVGCGATYHVVFNPPKKEGICDTCGQTLILRDDDKPETVQTRLNVYHDQTQPLIDFYAERGKLATVDGTRTMDEVFAEILEKLGE